MALPIATGVDGLSVQIHHITNAAQIDPACYVRFALLIRKPSS